MPWNGKHEAERLTKYEAIKIQMHKEGRRKIDKKQKKDQKWRPEIS